MVFFGDKGKVAWAKEGDINLRLFGRMIECSTRRKSNVMNKLIVDDGQGCYSNLLGVVEYTREGWLRPSVCLFSH